MRSTKKRSVQGTPGSKTPAYVGKMSRKLAGAGGKPLGLPTEPNNGQTWTMQELSPRKVD